jgi:uncharacterized membrane protein YbaN (DUF454 family)
VKIILALLGLTSLTLGIIGIFVPLLPTTPFLLLSAALFAKSSSKLYDWLLNHKVFGKFIKSYREEKSISLRIKISALTLLWTTICFSVFFVLNEKWWLQLLLISIAIGVTTHILSLKTKE